MRDGRETSNLALDRYELMRAIQKDSQPVQSRVLGVNDSPVLPPQRAPDTLLQPLGQPPAPAAPPLPAPAR